MLGKVVRSIKRIFARGLLLRCDGEQAVFVGGDVDHETLDPDLVASHKSLLWVVPEVQSNEGCVQLRVQGLTAVS